MNVLIVDDDASWAYLCAAMLRPVARKIRIAETYAEALETLDKPNGFDVVMLDLNLPDSPPNYTVQRIEEIRKGGRKVVLTSGAEMDDQTVAAAKSHGALDCLWKGNIGIADRLKAACQ